MTPSFASPSGTSIPLIVLGSDQLSDWLGQQSKSVANWVLASDFSAALGTVLLVPNASGAIMQALIGWGLAADRRRGRFHFATAAGKLPKGKYHIEIGLTAADLDEAALGWLLAQYNFDRYKSKPSTKAQLVAPKSINDVEIEAIAAGEVFGARPDKHPHQ